MSEANNNTAAEEVKTEDVLFKEETKQEQVETKTETTEAKADTEGKGQEVKADEKREEVAPTDADADLELEVTADSGLKPEDVEFVKQFAKENNLSKEAAQKILADKAKAISDFKTGQTQELEKRKHEWLDHAKADKEIGGEAFNQSVTLANRAIGEFAPPELRKVLDDSGLGNHPLLIKTFARIGKKMSNDNLVAAPKSQAAKMVADWDLFYPDPK
jgi:hypothetical protein